MNKTTHLLAALFLGTSLATAASLAGCSGEEPKTAPAAPVSPEGEGQGGDPVEGSGEGEGDNGDNGAEGDNGDDNTPLESNEGQSSTGTPKVKGACIAETTGPKCLDCCGALSPGALDFFTNAFKTCICQDSVCATACASSFCTGANPSANCQLCLSSQSATTCQTSAHATCKDDPSCNSFLTCSTNSQCEAKPK